MRDDVGIFQPLMARMPNEVIREISVIRGSMSSKIFKIVNKLRAGVVWANTYNKFDPTSPFGGYKESGFGREGGMHGLHAYVKLV